MSDSTHDAPHAASMSALTLGALGVVFGDIGTSPLYTLRECMHATGGAEATRGDLFGVLSLIFWSLTLVVTVKYLFFIMRAHNRGEGGIFALLAIVPERLRAPVEGRVSGVALLVVVGAALLYGDGAITPAISVLSATEGLAMVRPGLASAAVPLTCLILVGLFSFQRYGTGVVGKLFGPVMLAWFGTIGGLGAWHIARNPAVLAALDPRWAARYFGTHGLHAGLVLGSVVLAVTGGEALYADMGHFGVRPIRRAWLGLVFPALGLCYFGQGALLLRDPSALANPFFSMAPPGAAVLALVLLSSVATVIASQALISGAFSLTRQAMLLGYFPRVTVRHTAHHTEGQIYVPEINWLLAAACLLLVLGFQRSDRLASAYGIAVTGTMAITSVVFYVVTRQTWGWSRAKAIPVLVLFLSFDLPFFASNAVKLVDGGWVPVLIGIGFIAAMLIWSKGRTLLAEQYAQRFPTVASALPELRRRAHVRVPGTAVFLASSRTHVPPTLMHVVERGHALQETVVMMTVQVTDAPTVPASERSEVTSLGDGFHRLIVRYGFMEQPDVPAVLLAATTAAGVTIDRDEVTYYLGRERLLATRAGRMGAAAEHLFAFLQRNAVAADQHFGIPPRQVMEIGMQLDL